MKIGTWAQAGVAAIAGASGIAVAHTTSPNITAYPWAAGFGAKFANPATLPANHGNQVKFTPESQDLVVAHDASPFTTAYPWTVSGFGTKYANPSTIMSGNANGTDTVLATGATFYQVAFAHVSSIYIAVYNMAKNQTGWGGKFGNPASLPPDAGNGVSFANDRSAIVLAHRSSPFISGWPFSGSGFGTRYANPATLPPNNGNKVHFAPNNAVVGLAHDATPFLRAYAFDSATGFGTKYADPTLPVYALSQGRSIKFAPAQNAIVLGHLGPLFGEDGSCATAWEWSDGGGFGAILGGPLPAIDGSGNGIVFENSGGNVALAIGPSPHIIAHPWALGFGVRYAAPGTLPTGPGNGVDFAYA